ncbi:MAG: hypothetical protein SFX19_02990 [Alphaproteobacteria bacterium]|nr:hypothetical protein [Alphaproteobacteria bacterium]
MATPLPGTSVLRTLPDVVPPSVPNAALGPDYKGNGGYVSAAAAPSAASAGSVLSLLIPANLNTSSASLSASAIFATQLLSQDAEGSSVLFEVYDELVAAAQVKYKPSNAALPEPVPNNLFAKILAEEQTQNSQRVVAQAAAVPKETAAPAALQTAAAAPKLSAAPLKQKTGDTISLFAARLASGAYQASSTRNHAELEAAEAVDNIYG